MGYLWWNSETQYSALSCGLDKKNKAPSLKAMQCDILSTECSSPRACGALNDEFDEQDFVVQQSRAKVLRARESAPSASRARASKAILTIKYSVNSFRPQVSGRLRNMKTSQDLVSTPTSHSVIAKPVASTHTITNYRSQISYANVDYSKDGLP